MTSLAVGGEELGVRVRTLGVGRETDAGAGVRALISLSVDEAVRLPRDLQLALLVITLLGIVVFAFGSVFTARRVTTPLRGLADAAERLGRGDYRTPMLGLKRDDEIGELSQSFERMRQNIAENQAQILRLAYWDSLTGLPNRARFREAVNDAIAAAAPGSSVAIVMLDLNRFKHVNDVLGYRIGDLLLVQVAERLNRQLVRDGDLVARLSGDEFGILLRAGEPELALAVARRIEQSFHAPLALEEHNVDMGAAIGIACWPQHAEDGDALLNRAEVAMYVAKSRGSGPLLYDPSVDVASAQMLTLMTELRQAVEHDELRLYLQPKLALETGLVVGAEALVRWQHPQRGLVAPAEFIPFAEQTGFIRSLTLWVFEEAARQWRRAAATKASQLVLSVNLSTRDLLDQDLPQKFEARAGPAPACRPTAFCLEITESAIMDDPQRALVTLDRLSAIGFKLSIDDFGTGYSSLAYLKRLPVDELKIDQSFVPRHADRRRRRGHRPLDHRPGAQPRHRRRRRRRGERRRSGTCCASCAATWPRASTWAGRCRSPSSCNGRPRPRRSGSRAPATARCCTDAPRSLPASRARRRRPCARRDRRRRRRRQPGLLRRHRLRRSGREDARLPLLVGAGERRHHDRHLAGGRGRLERQRPLVHRAARELDRLVEVPSRLETLNWQNDLLLTQGQYPFDLAVHTLLVRPQNPASGYALEIGPVFQTDIDRTQLVFNVFFQRGFKALAGPTELAYQWQVRYRWNRWLHVGAQGFGELGPWDQWLPQDQQSHRAGPALFGSVPLGPGRIGWQAAYLVGKTYARRGEMFTARIKYDF